MIKEEHPEYRLYCAVRHFERWLGEEMGRFLAVDMEAFKVYTLCPYCGGHLKLEKRSRREGGRTQP